MEEDERKLMMTVAWLFARHGCLRRARTLLECLAEETPQEGIVAAALAELQLADGAAEDALATLRAATFPMELRRAEALLETRALRALGRAEEAAARWRRYVKASQGASREWVAE